MTATKTPEEIETDRKLLRVIAERDRLATLNNQLREAREKDARALTGSRDAERRHQERRQDWEAAVTAAVTIDHCTIETRATWIDELRLPPGVDITITPEGMQSATMTLTVAAAEVIAAGLAAAIEKTRENIAEALTLESETE